MVESDLLLHVEFSFLFVWFSGEKEGSVSQRLDGALPLWSRCLADFEVGAAFTSLANRLDRCSPLFGRVGDGGGVAETVGCTTVSATGRWCAA